MWDAVLQWLPGSVRAVLGRVSGEWPDRAEEIRIREGRPLELVASNDYAFVGPDGRTTRQPEGAFRPSRDDCLKLLDRVTNHSVYTMEEQLRRGYITVPGGHRIGLSGRAVLDRGAIRTLQQIGGFNVRIAREARGCAAGVVPLLWNAEARRPHHTLIVSPPQRGKTTLLRDAARLLSAGGWADGAGFGGERADRARKVGIVDERSEIAALVDGRPSFDVGPRTDVLDGCPKAEGMMLMIRAMSPEVLVVDELGRPEDAEAVLEALHAGIAVLATAHGRDLADVRGRPSLAPLFEAKVFGRIVTLTPSGPTGAVLDVRDAEGRRLEAPPARPVNIRGLGGST
ncbi:stage III sporulation protein AA [Paenibacillus sp.]|uniref:stage III sporulation protein AA n=1 Tax=Paenibacillus sp. TaxID=58172 RepID=UPI002D3EF702|nr:stage III sporulation protein AA [Paenibacillus sp.]HZG85114.1 stage III sporulation protein AA [Paenibacillus sp.]